MARTSHMFCLRSPILTSSVLLAVWVCFPLASARARLAGPVPDGDQAIEATPPALPDADPHVGVSGSQDWFTEVLENMTRDEYQFSALDDEVWSAPNRSQDLRSRVSCNGIDVFPREADASGAGAAWRIRLGTAGFGRVGDVRPVGGATLAIAGARAEIDHEVLVEWFVNDERGIEQGWTIACPPPGVGPLVIVIHLDDGTSQAPRADARGCLFVDATGKPRVRYDQLLAWDATGRVLMAQLETTSGGAELHVDDSGAVYPVTVDPVMTNAAWTAEGNQANANFGSSVASAGDVNGDGYADVIVGAPSYDNGELDEGRAYVYHGSASGLSITEAWTAESNQAGNGFGFGPGFGGSVASAGDVNGDGYADVIVGAGGYENGEASEGRAYVYHGSATGLSPVAAWIVESNQASAFLGRSVSTAGDVNGDGYADVIVGARRYDNGELNEGRAFVYHGSAAGLDAVEAWTAESNQANAGYGWSVATAGDVNGDGYSDVIVGARGYDNGEIDEGRAFVYHGSATGLDAIAAWTAESNLEGDIFGASVATAGDVNNDGFSDVIVGSQLYENGETWEGRAYAYHGSVAGLDASPAWTVESNRAWASFGFSVSSAGDVDGDGFSDVVVGAPGSTNGSTSDGFAYVYRGSASGLETIEGWSVSHPPDVQFAYSVATAGDVNGDSYADVLVGANWESNGELREGVAYLYLGASASVPELYCTAGTTASGCNAQISSSGVASASAASGFLLNTTSVEGSTDGLYYFGSNGRQANSWGNGTSFQCVVPPVTRGDLLLGSGTSGLCDGAFSQDINALWCPGCPKPQKNPGAGAVVQAQLWFLDPFNTADPTTSLSDAIEFVVVP